MMIKPKSLTGEKMADLVPRTTLLSPDAIRWYSSYFRLSDKEEFRIESVFGK